MVRAHQQCFRFCGEGPYSRFVQKGLEVLLFRILNSEPADSRIWPFSSRLKTVRGPETRLLLPILGILEMIL